MGLNNSQEKITVKFTPKGKHKILLQGLNNLFAKFSLGDSEVNYGVDQENITEISGSNSNSIFHNVGIKHNVVVDNSGTIFKAITKQNNIISEANETQYFNFSSIGNKIIIDRLNKENLGLLKMLGLPITKDDETNLKLYAEKYAVFPISGYGDIIEGLDLKITIGDEEFYSAFGEGTSKPDATIFDDGNIVSPILMNAVMLFSDNVQRPRNDENLSWSTGHGKDKPYANGKSFYKINQKDFTIFEKVAGYVLLDKGFVVITDQAIIDKLGDEIEVTGNYVNHKVFNEIICQINRGEFLKSTNPTYKSGSEVRVTEIGIYDATNTLIAIGKFNEELRLSGIKPYTFSIVLDI